MAADTNIDGPILTAGTVSIAGSQAGSPIDLGNKAIGTLGLTDDELAHITAGGVQIGDVNSGSIKVSAAITPKPATNVSLTSGGAIIFGSGSIDTGGGDLMLAPGGDGVS